MKIKIEIPVHVDGTLIPSERKQLREHIEAGLGHALRELKQTLLPGEPRMLGIVCRFSFGEIKAKVE